MSEARAVTLRANFQKRYLGRYLVMAGLGLFMACWFAFDAFIGYPREQERCAAYEELAEKVTDKKELYDQWKELARSRGWNVTTPKDKAADFENKIAGQYVYGSLCIVLAIPAMFFFMRNKNRWVELSGDELTTSWGQSFNFRNVTSLNKQRWVNKGIAKAYYKSNDGEQVFVFDDFKFDREALDKMLAHLETHLSSEQIVGGAPERDSATDNSATEDSATKDSGEPTSD